MDTPLSRTGRIKKIRPGISVWAVWSLIVLFLTGNKLEAVNPLNIAILIAFFAFISYLIIKNEDNSKEGKMIAAITILAVAIRTFYVLYTGAEQRQHDMGEFDTDLGNNYHAEIIEYFLENHRLLNEDITQHWQFYHPPLQHALSAAFFGIYREIAPSQAHNWDALQTLSLFYSLVTLEIIRKFTELWNLSPRAKTLAYMAVAFHPELIVFSGSINNDPPAFMFALIALYMAVRWYNDEKKPFIRLLAVGLCIGLGMMAKLSAGLIAFPVGFLMLKAFFESRKKAVMAAQYLAFLAVCAPLGLWYQIRSYVLWKVPITYVAVPDTVLNPGLIIDAPFWKRFLAFGDGVNYNIISETLDTAVFDADYYRDHLFIALIGYLLLITFTAFTATVLINCLITWAKDRSLMNTVMTVLLASQLIFYVYFCFSYPYTCTMEFRYIVPTIIAAAYYTGKSKDISPRLASLFTTASVYAFAAMSLIFYALIWIKDMQGV